MVMTVLEFGGLHLLHWIISGVIPVALLITAVIYMVIARKTVNKVRDFQDQLSAKLQSLESRQIENLTHISNVFQQAGLPLIRKQFQKMEQDSDVLYDGRWLPNPDLYLSSEQVFSTIQSSSLSLRPSARLLSVGLLGSLISLLMQSQYPASGQIPAIALILAPAAVGLALSLILLSESMYGIGQIKSFSIDMKRLLESRLPVFSDQAGLGLMIDQFMSYDRDMNTSLKAFNETAVRLTESDMADGIRRSVEQVLLDSVAPAVQESSAVLKKLADELVHRQERGMQELAGQFASALTSDMAAHLKPVNKEIAQMSSLMTDVRNYIEYAMRALDTVKEESKQLLADTQTALQQMAQARGHLSEDFGKAGQQLQLLTSATSHMADIQQNNEQGLAKSIEQLSLQLASHSDAMETLVEQAASAMQQAQASAADQQSSAEEHIANMSGHVSQLSRELGDKISLLLEQVDTETSSVAKNAAEIGARLGTLNETLAQSLNDFSRESADYVHSTLQAFDSNLAELVRRMTQATVEIRDAVDALPAALQQRARFDA